jgi:hypothetical protein
MTPMAADQPSGTDGRRRQAIQCQGRVDIKSGRRPVENGEYASFIRRILRAYSRRVQTAMSKLLSS